MNYLKKRRTDIIMVAVKKVAEYYLKNREILKENANNKYRSLSEEEKKQKNIKQTDIKNKKANKKASQMSIK